MQMQIGLLGDLGAQRINAPRADRLCACAGLIWRTKCTLVTVALLPHTTFKAALAAELRRPMPGTGPYVPAQASLRTPPHKSGGKVGSHQPMEETQGHAVAGQHAVRARRNSAA